MRGSGHLCQGRGSAANSAVCFCLGITSVNPTEIDLLFERFVSKDRNEPPDIDVDFEHERREEVIQYIYAKYGRHRAGIAATVISYRSRSAIRDVGKVFGLSEDVVNALSRSTWGWSNSGVSEADAREAGLDPGDRSLQQALVLARELIGFPRHLSQHGRFRLTRGPSKTCADPERGDGRPDFVEWDKDDLDTLGILKIDVLALGMLSCIRRAFDLLDKHYGIRMGLADVPQDDKGVYDMLCEADAIGVFQVESRAQMSMLPRLRPRCFYDLVVEVAIVRPGPIQGDMVHPYLRRRSGEEKVTYPSKVLEDVLCKTFGVPLFQEQAMKIAIVAAGFTPGESDQLRRAMATFRKSGTIGMYRDKFIAGMRQRIRGRFRRALFQADRGLCRLRLSRKSCRELRAAGLCFRLAQTSLSRCVLPAILNAQPMGFYAAAQLVRDAREHGVEIREVDVNHSDWDCTLERRPGDKCAVRLGLRQVKGFQEASGRIVEERRGGGFDSVRHFWLRTGLGPRVIERLADADAFRSLGLDRRAALWAVRGLGGYGGGNTGRQPAALPLFAALEEGGFQREEEVALPAMPLGEHVGARLRRRSAVAEGASGFFCGRALRRGARCRMPAQDDRGAPRDAGRPKQAAAPGTARRYYTLEDETGIANIIIWPKLFEARRRIVITSRLLLVKGRVQKEGIVVHVVARA